jgi:hypothetical protein
MLLHLKIGWVDLLITNDPDGNQEEERPTIVMGADPPLVVYTNPLGYEPDAHTGRNKHV